MTRKQPIFADFFRREHDFLWKSVMIRQIGVIRVEFERTHRDKPHDISRKFMTGYNSELLSLSIL